MDDIYFRKIMTLLIFVILIVLSFFLLKPILISIIIALTLAFVLSPVYERLNNIIDSKNLSALLICIKPLFE